VNRHLVGALPQSKSGKQTGYAEHVVEMGVGQQNPIEPPEAGAAPQQLALRPLPAIDQDAVTSSLHQKTRMIAPLRGS
jgi:hypothetical protein